MKGFLTVEEGPGKGTSKFLTAALTIVGRSKNADLQIEDPLVSRRHLEIRVETEGIFAENVSTQSASLNGKPLAGIVSLNPGDLLEVGSTKLRFKEAFASATAVAEAAGSAKAEIDGTRVSPDEGIPRPRGNHESAPDETRVMVEDGTRMLNPSELPNWVAQKEIKPDGTPKKSSPVVMVIFLVLLLAAGGGCYFYWTYFARSQKSTNDLMAYKDAMYSFNLSYPRDWNRTEDSSGVVAYGVGKESDTQWVRLSIFTDKDPQHGITGLTDGFNHYKDVLKKRYSGFELTGSEIAGMNNAKGMSYWFLATGLQGRGLYVLNSDGRIVLETVSAVTTYQQNATVFANIFKSFQFGDYEQQLLIDFPLPDGGMQQLALASPSELARQVDNHILAGKMLQDNRDVKPDNLFCAMQEYRKALQLAIAGPDRLPSYRPAAKGLSEATKIFNQLVQRQEYLISHAVKVGDRDSAYWAANKLMQMIPDKTDDIYNEAYRVVKGLHPEE